MAEIVLTDVEDIELDPNQAQLAINANNTLLEETIELLLSRSEKEPNPMLSNLDLGGFRVINLGAPEAGTDMCRVIDAKKLIYILLGFEPPEESETDNEGVSLVDVLRLVEAEVGPLTIE